MRTMSRRFLMLACLLGVASAAPVSARNKEAAETRVRDTAGIAGEWEGQWESRKNGHQGALSCQVEPVGNGRYLFRYRAVWGKIMKGNFQISCDVSPSGSGFSVHGTKSLGIFGTYHHEGRITPHSFEATFRSDRKNLGSFRLRRPEGWKP